MPFRDLAQKSRWRQIVFGASVHPNFVDSDLIDGLLISCASSASITFRFRNPKGFSLTTRRSAEPSPKKVNRLGQRLAWLPGAAAVRASGYHGACRGEQSKSMESAAIKDQEVSPSEVATAFVGKSALLY
jgi:hypothetical protein